MSIAADNNRRTSEAPACLYTTGQGDHLRIGRTIRSLRVIGTEAECIGMLSAPMLQALLDNGGPVLFVRAGCWFIRPELFESPGPSATGRGLCAFGLAERLPADEARWGESPREPNSPPPPTLYLDEVAVRHIATRRPALLSEVHQIALNDLRTVHYPLLDVYEDSGIRILQVITGLQRGGAERLTLKLVSELPALNVRTRLVTLRCPSRDAFPAPTRTIDLSKERDRAQALTRVATRFGADVVHGHLLSGAEMRSISNAGLPLLATIHNSRQGWPEGLEELGSSDAILLAACSQAVERELIESKLPMPVRTVWNGINVNEFRPTPERLRSARELRAGWSFGEQDLVLVALANPRPQKRLHLLPAVLAALRSSRDLKRGVRLVLAGEASPANSDAQQCIRQMREEFGRLGLDSHVKWIGPVQDVASLLAACDVLVSPSAHEGLSLAQMEALAMGCDVVATEVGGARELAADNPRLRLLPAEASAERFAEAIACVALNRVRQTSQNASASRFGSLSSSGGEGKGEEADLLTGHQRLVERRPFSQPAFNSVSLERSPGLSPNWSSRQMAKRYAWLYPRAISAAKREKGEGLWLITNNFSTGGAQSSARRLLLGLAAEGVKVRAAVIEEQRHHPTPGRRALMEAGICVEAFEGASELSTIEDLLAAIDRDKPQSVIFWNLRPGFKVLIADALLDVPVFDVSPGEMYFESLQAFFAKPRAGLPYRTPRDYGARLAGVIVKYSAEAHRAAEMLGAKVHVVPNGVPLGNGIVETSGPRESVVFGTAARINPRKRIEDLFEALRVANGRLPAWTLKVAGGVERNCEDYAQRLREQAQGLPVEWLGDVRDVPGFHRDLDVFLMVSEPAGCPNASLEAMASGLPVIATDAGGASEQIVCGQTGRLVPPRDATEFAHALVELATQPTLRRTMGARARSLVEERFRVERMVADYRRICLPPGSW